MSKSRIFPQESHIDYLLSKTCTDTRELFSNMGYQITKGAFNQRMFILYHYDEERNTVVDARLLVKDFFASATQGAVVELENLDHRGITSDSQLISYTPTRLFGYDILVRVPLDLSIWWQRREFKGEASDVLVFALTFHVQANPAKKIPGSYGILTPREFKLYNPGLTVELDITKPLHVDKKKRIFI